VFDGKKVLITGGTGSLGKAITNRLLSTNVDTIRIYSRGEWKQVEMQSDLQDKRLRFLIGDVRDKERLERALDDIDFVIHAAALKHVPVAEYNPFESVKTNVYGTQNLIDACLDKNVKLAIAIGTDKSVSPLNTYGATKLLVERLFISANNYKGKPDIRFSCVRYGNVFGSRGSVVPTFIQKIKNKEKLRITDPTMTRFNITMNEAMDLIFRAIELGVGGEVFVPKLKAYKLGDLVEAMKELTPYEIGTEIINVRQGEKFHESLIGDDELRITYESEKDYIIYEDIDQNDYKNSKLKLEKTNLTSKYSSDVVNLLSIKEIKDLLIQEKFFPLE